MKSYKDITYRYFKGQKNRTLLTLLGIILSVALISAVGTIAVSFRDALIIDVIRDNGSYHAIFKEISREQIDKPMNHVEVSEAGISGLEGSARVVETTDEERQEYGWDIPYRYLEINSYDTKALEMLPSNLKEGRFPKTSDEIVIEYWMANYFKEKVKIGDRIKLTIGDRSFKDELDEEGELLNREETFENIRENEYTVVGFTEPRYLWKGNLETKAITKFDNNSTLGINNNVYIQISNLKDAKNKIENVARDIGVDIENVDYNENLLRLHGQSIDDDINKFLISISTFIISLIVISTVAVIYNAFNISVLERISQFGLLRSIGATPKQIRGIVLKEAMLLSIIGIPIGLFSGVFAMKVVLYIIGLLKADIPVFSDMEITISKTVFIISTIIGLVTVFLSAIGPAKRAGKVSPLEAIRNTGDLKKESFKKVKSSLIVRRILGVEGEIAYKNLRRNRKRFLITVFSMVISISLFITFSSFSDFMFKVGIVNNKDMGDFAIRGDMEGKGEEIYAQLKDLKDVKRIYKVQSIGGQGLIDENKISKKMIEMEPYMFEDKKDGLTEVNNVEVITIGDENFDVLKNLLKEGNLDIEKLNEEDGVLVINNTYAYNDKTGGSVLMEGYKLTPGDELLYFPYHLDQEGEDMQYAKLKVTGILEKGILDFNYNLNSSINVITTEKVWNKLSRGEYEDSKYTDLKESYMEMYIEMIKDGDIENIRSYLEETKEEISDFHYIDYAQSAKEDRIMGIIMSIFLYGFVAIIALISSINIINTISTNIILRTKEIAMIKAVGMNESRIKRMVALESLFYGIYAAIFGGVIGTGLTYIMFKIVFDFRPFEWIIPWKNIGIACIGATIIALLSGAYPLRRINDKIIVESMKQEN